MLLVVLLRHLLSYCISANPVAKLNGHFQPSNFCVSLDAFPSIPTLQNLSLHQLLTYIVGFSRWRCYTFSSPQCAVCPESFPAHKGCWPQKWPFETEKLTEMDFPARMSRFFHALHQSLSLVFLDQKNNLRMTSTLSTKLWAQLRQRFLNLGIIDILGQVTLCLVGGGCCPVKRRIFSRIPGLYHQVDASKSSPYPLPDMP